MRIIVAGGRDFSDYKTLDEKIREIFISLGLERKEVEIVCGKAKGADTLGEDFAKKFQLKLKYFPADWTQGKKAGFLRNEEMAVYAQQDNGVLIAFWDGISKGTKHMIQLAKSYKLKIYVFNYKGEAV